MTNFEKNKAVYSSVKIDMLHYLLRTPSHLENEVYLQYSTLEIERVSRQAFKIYGVQCTYADIQELLEGSGTHLPYLKSPVLRIFYLLLQDKLKAEKPCYFLQNSMDITATLNFLSRKVEEGIFFYKYFIYSGVHDDIWCSVIIEKVERFQYKVITFLPNQECKEANTKVSEFVTEAMKEQFDILRKRNVSESPWTWENLVFKHEVVAESIANFKIEDAGTYTIMRTYLYLRYENNISLVTADLHKFRRLILYMMVTMDSNYGQMKIETDMSGQQKYLHS